MKPSSPDKRGRARMQDEEYHALCGTLAVFDVIFKHRRHVELSPGAGKDVQAYALAVIDDIEADLRRAPIAAAPSHVGTINRGDQADPATGGSSPGDPRPQSSTRSRDYCEACGYTDSHEANCPLSAQERLANKIERLTDDGGEGCPFDQDELDLMVKALRGVSSATRRSTDLIREAANCLDDIGAPGSAARQIASDLRRELAWTRDQWQRCIDEKNAIAAGQWVDVEKLKADAYEDAARRVEKLAEEYTQEHGSLDQTTNAYELHHRHGDRIEAWDDAVEAIRKRKGEKCHVTQATTDGTTTAK